MLSSVVHAITPVAVIVTAGVLCALGKIDGATAIATIGAAGGVGAVVVARKG